VAREPPDSRATDHVYPLRLEGNVSNHRFYIAETSGLALFVLKLMRNTNICSVGNTHSLINVKTREM
jgi:hypothetical protein